jgi:hypothetical protein
MLNLKAIELVRYQLYSSVVWSSAVPTNSLQGGVFG